MTNFRSRFLAAIDKAAQPQRTPAEEAVYNAELRRKKAAFLADIKAENPGSVTIGATVITVQTAPPYRTEFGTLNAAVAIAEELRDRLCAVRAPKATLDDLDLWIARKCGPRAAVWQAVLDATQAELKRLSAPMDLAKVRAATAPALPSAKPTPTAPKPTAPAQPAAPQSMVQQFAGIKDPNARAAFWEKHKDAIWQEHTGTTARAEMMAEAAKRGIVQQKRKQKR